MSDERRINSFLSGLYIKEPESISEWCEKNLSFNARVSPTDAGPVSLARQPYMREPLDAFGDWNTQKIYLPWAAQTGKTTLLLLGLAWLIDNDPLPVLWTAPSDKLAQSICRNRLQPLIEANECLKRHRLNNEDLWTALEIGLDYMTVTLTGAHSPSNLASRAIAVAIMDEVAKYKHEDRTEAHPISLIEQRTKTFARRLLLYASTPSTEESLYWRGYVSSDQRKYYVPCPHCKRYIELIISKETLVWDKTEDGGINYQLVESSARYVCQECRQEIWDTDRPRMLDQGEWRITNPNGLPGVRGYHLNALYSPYESWGEIAVKLVTAMNSLWSSKLLQDFTNSEEALPYTQRKANIKEKDVERLIDKNYQRGEVPEDPYYLVAAYDPGVERTHWVVMAVGPGGESWVIDWGTVVGVRTHYHVWFEDAEDGGKVQRREVTAAGIWEHVKTLNYGGLSPSIVFIDSGYNAQAVYEECLEDPALMYPTKGSEGEWGTWNESKLTAWPDLVLYSYVDHTAKTQLYAERIAGLKAPRLHLPKDADAELIQGLSGQILEEVRPGHTRWKRISWDHYGDCVKLCCVSWWILRSSFESTIEE